jgi:radial spoke head protein 4A
VSYPPFPGTEAHLLRAQIARIAAATVISPSGYYKFDDEEEPQEGVAPPVVLNTEFEWPTHESLTLLENWTHHIPYILPQGRTQWVNPNPPKESSGDDDEEGKEESEEAQVEPETGPSILTAIAEDAEVVEGLPTWTVRMAAPLSPSRYSPVYLRSNRWPGAFTVGFNDKFANIYVGWGQKDLNKPYAAPALTEVQREYGVPTGPGTAEDVTEKNDPTLEEEQAYNEANKKQDEDGEGEGEEEAEDA